MPPAATTLAPETPADDTVDIPIPELGTSGKPDQTPKQFLANILKIVADDCTFEDIRDHLDFVEMLARREAEYDRIMAECGGSIDEAIRRGQLIPQEEIEKQVDAWFAE